MVYSYQSIDDDSLARYEAFLNNPTTKKFNDSMTKGINSGLEKVISNLVIDLATTLKNKVNGNKIPNV